jgi:hypothetical protein
VNKYTTINESKVSKGHGYETINFILVLYEKWLVVVKYLGRQVPSNEYHSYNYSIDSVIYKNTQYAYQNSISEVFTAENLS